MNEVAQMDDAEIAAAIRNSADPLPDLVECYGLEIVSRLGTSTLAGQSPTSNTARVTQRLLEKTPT
jgi:hypothetical protein